MKTILNSASSLFLLSALTFALITPCFAQNGDVSAPNVVAPAQPAAPATTTGATTATTSQAAPTPAGGIFGSPIIMMVVMLGVMYFLMIRPQQKRQKDQ